MKKTILSIIMLLFAGMTNFALADRLHFGLIDVDDTPAVPGHNKSPLMLPTVDQDGHVLTFIGSHADYTLTLLDENGDEAYVVAVPSSTSIVVLPATLTGTFEVQLDFGGSYIFVSEIEL